MKKTAEEKKKAQVERMEERRRLNDKFPRCLVSSQNTKGECIQLVYRPGEERLVVRTNAPTTIFYARDVGGDVWKECTVWMSLEQLSEFAVAVTARLKAEIEELNGQIAKVNSITATAVKDRQLP